MTIPRLHVVVTDEAAAGQAFERQALEMQERCGAALALHLRLREVPVRRQLAMAERLEEGAVATGGWLVINRRLDLALAVGAEAVQLGRGALPIGAVRDVAGESLRVGASVHDVPTADLRRREGADYLLAGSVYETASHPGRPPAGFGLIERLAPMPLPVVAIGGITAARAREVREAGAAGVAVVRAVWSADDPVEAAADLCAASGIRG
ncbi:MAG: thiamine phosphate synthase [Gemmatimonadota bacterium]